MYILKGRKGSINGHHTTKEEEECKEKEKFRTRKYVLQGCLLVLFCPVPGDVFQSFTEKLVLGLYHSSNKSLLCMWLATVADLTLCTSASLPHSGSCITPIYAH